MFAAFLLIVATKSLVDAFWNIKFGPISILAIQGILFPVMFFKLFKEKKYFPKSWRGLAACFFIALSLGVFWAFPTKPLGAFQILIININIFLGFFLIPILVNSKKRLKQLLIAIMICGIFPVLVSMFQFQTGVIFQQRATVGLTRYVGFYHDAFPVRFYGLMTIIAALLYNFVFKLNTLFSKLRIVLVSLGALFSVYLVFSKAAVGIIGLWIVLLLVFSKSRAKHLLAIVIGGAIVFLIFGDAFTASIEQLFSKEVGYQSGTVKDARYTLAGRGYIWQEHWHFWSTEQSVFFQWFGDGLNKPVHNEYLRVLMVNGIIGLIFLIVFLIRSIRNVFKIHKKIRIFAMMLLGMYFVDSIGLVPGVYYYYNILVWGIFGTLLLSPHLFIKKQDN